MNLVIPFTVNRVVRHAWANMVQPRVGVAGVQERGAQAMCTRRSESTLLHSTVSEPPCQTTAVPPKASHERPAVRSPAHCVVISTAT